MANLQVAQTILQQLGGGRFLTMTGAKNLVGSENSLSMRINSVNADGRRVNVVSVTLDPSDTYTVTASYLRAGKLTTVASVSDVYNDQLQETFTRLTGLYTSLGTMGVLPRSAVKAFNNRHED